MATINRETIPGMFRFAENSINTALATPTIAAALAESGTDEAALRHGLALLATARKQHNIQGTEQGEYHSASEQIEALWEKAKASYSPLISYARLALKSDPWAIGQLDISGRRKTTLTGWIEQANLFYTRAIENQGILDNLARYNITPAKLQAGLAQVQALANAQRQQIQERGESEQATITRDAALEALDDWLDEFVEVARLALRDTPQLLESLSIHVRS